METRPLGRTGHMSAVAILGSFCFSQATQDDTDVMMEKVMAAGVNHIDVAPSYGQAEERLGPWLARHRERFFLGCKTMERARTGVSAEMRRSLERLQVAHFDLYQLHAVTTIQELDAATQAGGALEAIIEAQQAGLTRFIGITSHGVDAPAILLEALRRFDFDTVLFPINFIQYTHAAYQQSAQELLQQCRARNVGSMIIKSIARGPWGKQPQTYNTWYRPFTETADIQRAVNFCLSQDVTGLCTAGDIHLLPLVLQACQNFAPLSAVEQKMLVASASAYEPLFA